MDEQQVREHAVAHGRATVAGDLKRAGSDLTAEAMAQAPGIMSAMPAGLRECEIESVAGEGDNWVAAMRYVGDGGELRVESRWAERDGRPKITALRVSGEQR